MNEITDLSGMAVEKSPVYPQNEALPLATDLAPVGGANEAMLRDTAPPPGFASRPDGVYEVPDSDRSGETGRWLCSPLAVLARYRDRSGRGWGRLIEIANPEGMKQSVAVLDSLLETHASKARAQLVDQGLRLRDGTEARQALMRLIKGWNPPATFTSTERRGWTDEACASFVLDDGRVLGDDRVVFMGHSPGGVTNAANSVGSVDGWRTDVALCCIDNPLLIVAVSLAFAAPLLELLDEEGGGLHFRGASSRGKTTLQRVAVSVWGGPASLHSWRATANGIEGLANANNSMLLALDEIAEIDGKALDNAAYMLANGIGKSRSDACGRPIPQARWRVALLSTGEIDVAAKIAEGGGRFMAGQSVRLLNIAADGRRYGVFDELHRC